MEYKVVRAGQEDELYHYGVPGMKWGVRKQKYYEKKYGTKIKNKEEYEYLKKRGLAGHRANASHIGNKKNYSSYQQQALKFYREEKKRNSKKYKESHKSPTEVFRENLEKAKKITGDSSIDGNTILKTKIGKQVTNEWLKQTGDMSFLEDTSYYKDVYDRYFKSLGIKDER